jgi:hypothetical protein
MLTQMTGRLDRRAGTPARNDDRGDVGEQIGRQPDRPDRLELCDLDEDRVQAHVARRRLDQGHVLAIVVLVVADGDQRLETLDDGPIDALCDQPKQRLLGGTAQTA